MLRKGFFHADLHKGNIFYDEETKGLSFIDCGLCGQIDKKILESKPVKNILGIAIAAGNGIRYPGKNIQLFHRFKKNFNELREEFPDKFQNLSWDDFSEILKNASANPNHSAKVLSVLSELDKDEQTSLNEPLFRLFIAAAKVGYVM